MASERPSLRARLSAALQGGVPATDVRPYVRAGAVAYEDFLEAESLRHELVAAGLDPTTASPAETSQLLCAWNAYALQTLAEAFLDAEDRLAGGQAMTVAQVTAAQVQMLVRDVPVWSGRARRAAADPGYDVAAEVPLPAPMAPWVVVEPCPRSHLEAMRVATVAMVERIEAALADLGRAPGAGGARHVSTLSGMLADVRGRVGAVTGMLAGPATGPVHESAEAAMRSAVAQCFALGQITARPRLLQGPSTPVYGARPAPQWPQQPPPGGPGYGYPHGGYHGHGHHGGHH